MESEKFEYQKEVDERLFLFEVFLETRGMKIDFYFDMYLVKDKKAMSKEKVYTEDLGDILPFKSPIEKMEKNPEVFLSNVKSILDTSAENMVQFILNKETITNKLKEL